MKSTTHFYTIDRKTHKLDASGEFVGRLATKVANLLRGKHKPTFTPQVDNGDFVVVENASAIRFSGKKLESKVYFAYSGYPGGMKEKKASELMVTDPSQILVNAVSRMLPKNKHREIILKRLTVKN